MGKERTDASPYESRYGGGWVTPAQYLAEGMIARQARTKQVDLPPRFWNLDRWKRDFLLQLRHATALLKLYSPEAILRVLRSKEAKSTYSLNAKWLDPLLKTEQSRLCREEESRMQKQRPATPASVEKDVTEKPRESFKQEKSVLSKLRDLDN